MSIRKLTTLTTTDNSLSPSIKWYGNLNFCLIFKESCLKEKNATYTPPNVIKLFIVYELDTWLRDLSSNFTLKACLFGGVRLAKNVDLEKYVYSGYGTGFDSRSKLSLPDGSVGKNFIIFGVDMSSSLYVDNKKKDILILGIGPAQALDNTTLWPYTWYLFSFSRSNRKFC